MRAISPVIATVIILAVTVAIAVAVIGWITGLFGAATGGTEQLQIMPDSYINVTPNQVSVGGATYNYTLHLHVMNKGGSDVTVYRVEVSGLGPMAYCALSNSDVTKLSDFTNLDLKDMKTNHIVIGSGDHWLLCTGPGAPVAGNSYTAKMYTSNGNVFTATIVAKSS